MQFGDRWLADGKPAPLTLVHVNCGCDSHPLVACSHCGKGVNARDVKYRDGPGAGRHPAKAGRNTRRASDGNRFLLGRPSSVSRALQIIGDKWSFMVVREGFFGNRRYDKILTELSIAPNILTDRLSARRTVFSPQAISEPPDRYEYSSLTWGATYGPFIAAGWRPLACRVSPSCSHLLWTLMIHAEVSATCKQPIVAATCGTNCL